MICDISLILCALVSFPTSCELSTARLCLTSQHPRRAQPMAEQRVKALETLRSTCFSLLPHPVSSVSPSIPKHCHLKAPLKQAVLKPLAHFQGEFLTEEHFPPYSLTSNHSLFLSQIKGKAHLPRTEKHLTISSHGNRLLWKELLVQCVRPPHFSSWE